MFSRQNCAQRTRLCTAGGSDQPGKNRAKVESTIEQVLNLGKVTMRVLGEAEGVERAGEGSLQVAKHRVHGQEVRILDAGRSTASDVWLVQDACALEDGEAAQAVGDHRRWGNQ